MPVHNEEIAVMFEEMAELLELEQANPFRVRAYRTAARTVRNLGRELQDLVAAGEDLTELPGIGKDLAAKIREILDSGHAAFLDRLHKEVPAGLAELLKIPGLGPKRVKLLNEQLGIASAAQLAKAAKAGRLRSLPGFGAKTEANLLHVLASQRTEKKKRFLYAAARQYAEPLLQYLQDAPGVRRAVIAGSFRRGRETVGDLDILVTAREGKPVMDHFVAYDEVADVVSQGSTRGAVVLRSGLQVDLRVVEAASFGAALHYFTGSKAHNIAIRRRGQQRGLKINEYGVFKGKRQIAGKTEASVYKSVGLPLIPPPLREGRGEIEAAAAGKLPRLIQREDLKGDLHAHTDATDGQLDLESLARAAKRCGFRYLAITDHSQRLTVAHGLDPRRLARQLEAVDRLNERLSGITLLKGIEVDILADGGLDLPDSILSRLDLVVGSVHSGFRLPAKKQTERILRAVDQKYFSILGHPTGRLLLEREAYELDMERILQAAKDRGCFLELNAQPQRLDLNDVYCRMAKQAGVLLSLSTDAHSEADLDNQTYGIQQAQRGWLEKGDVLNTRPLAQVRKLLARTMG